MSYLERLIADDSSFDNNPINFVFWECKHQQQIKNRIDDNFDEDEEFNPQRIQKWGGKKVEYITSKEKLPHNMGYYNYDQTRKNFNINRVKFGTAWDMRRFGERRCPYYSRACLYGLSKSNSVLVCVEKINDDLYKVSTRDYLKKKYVNRMFGDRVMRTRGVKRHLRKHELTKLRKGKYDIH